MNSKTVNVHRYGHTSSRADDSLMVLSGDGSNSYIVHLSTEEGRMECSCTCPSFTYHKNVCKHIYAAQIHSGLATEVKEADHPANYRKRSIFRGPPRRYRTVKRRRMEDSSVKRQKLFD